MISITENAAKQVEIYKKQNNVKTPVFLRVAVKASGCVGFEYSLNFDDQFNEKQDIKTEQFGVVLVVDKKSMLLLENTVIDYYESLEQSGFTFNNPNVVKQCGCGSSFSV